MRIVHAAPFRRSLDAQLEFLVAREDQDGILRLREDLAALETLLASFPDAGRELARSEDATLRKLKLRRCPFVVWYVRRSDRVTLARIFHARQRPVPRQDALRGSVLRYKDPTEPVE